MDGDATTLLHGNWKRIGGWVILSVPVPKIPQIFFVTVTQDQIDIGLIGKGFWRPLGITSGDHQTGVGVVAAQFADQFSRLPLTFTGDRTGIDDDDTCLIQGTCGIMAVIAPHLEDQVGFKLIDPTSHGQNGYPLGTVCFFHVFKRGSFPPLCL
ncbi:MAG: hypothetical protein HW380_3036 [Magnetococcales bacterium]|nr:hypothetical protein [Magnetococcales bacterium]